jgi:predicted nucleotidyltransferase
MGKSAKELYEERRKKQNSSNSTNSKKSAKELYEERRKYNSIDTSNVNEEYINSFISDAKKFLSSAQEEYGKVGWSNAASSYENINKSYSDLNTRYDTVKAWLYKNKNNLDEKSYNDLYKGLDSVGSGFSSTIDAFSNAKDYYSQWDTEEDYNEWYDLVGSVLDADDLDIYKQKGLAVSNPTWKESLAPVYIFGWKPFGEGEKINNIVTFAETNKNEADEFMLNSDIGAANEGQIAELVWLINNHMEDYEKDVYNYYIGKGDVEKANEYITQLTDEFRRRHAGKVVEKIDNTALELVFSAFAGLEQFASGIGNLDNFIMGTDADPTTAMQYAQSAMSSNNAGIWKVSNDLLNTTANMLPSIMVGAATGSPLLGSLTLGTSAVGNAYAEMRNLGYDEWQSRGYATLVGASETVLSYALGGISKLGGKVSGKVISNLISKIDNAFARTAIKVGGSMLSEGLEEAIQTALEPAFQALATGEDFESAKWDEILYSGLLGALTAGLLEGAPTIAGTAFNSYNTGKIYGNSAPSIVADAIKTDPTNLHAQRMQTRLDNGKSVSGYQLNRLITDTDKAKIKSAIETRLTELGEKRDIGKLSEALTKKLIGESLTLSEKALIKNSTFGKRIINEANPDNIEAGTYASGWAENIGTRALNPQAYNKSAYDLAKQMHGIREAAEKKSVDKTLAETGKTIEENIKVSESGKTIYNDEDVAINKIVSTKGGLKVELDNGKTVSARDLSFGTKEEALMYEMVARMETTPETANELISTFKPANMAKASQYFTSIPVAYQYGKIGYEAGLKNINLTKQEKRLAYNRGKADAIIAPKNKTSVSKKDKANTTKTEASKTEKNGIVYEGGFTYDESTATKIQKISMAHIEVISKMSSLEVHVFESVEENGERVYYLNGERKLAPNGYFTDGNKIYIDFNAGDGGEGAMLYTMSHEVSHYIRKWNEKGFKELADFLIEQYGKHGVPVHKLLEDQKTKIKNRYERENKTLPSEAKLADMAYEELVADAMSDMFTDPKAYEKLLKLKQKNRTLWEKVGEAIKQLLDKLKTALGIYKTADAHVAIEAYFTREFTSDVYNKLQDLYLKAFVEADANYEAAMNDGSIDLDGNEQEHILSDRTFVEGAGLQFILSENGTDYKVLDKNGKPVKNVTAEMIVNSPLGNLVTMAKNEGFLGKGKEATLAANKQYEFLAELVNMCINYNGLAPIWETAGTMVFSSMKSNADKQYGLTVDFSTVCKKTQAIVDAMSEAMLRLGRGLTRSEVETIYLEVGKAGESTPCPVCYVFSRWMGIGGILDQISRFQDKYTAMSEASLQKFIADIQERIRETANTPDNNGKLKSKFFNAKGEISEGKVIAELKSKASNKAASALKAIANNSNIKLQIQELEALMQNQDSKSAKKTAKQIENLKNKLQDEASLEKEMHEANDTLEEYEAYQWLTRTMMMQSEGKWVKNSAFKPVPKDILFDLNKGDKFAEGYPLTWAFRTGKGASAGKAIVPYADARVGEAIQAVASQSPKDIKIGLELNPFLNSDTAGRLKILKSAIEKQARQNLLGGQRYQSTSDFRYEYGSDYLITFLEMQAIGAKVQLYTKVIEAVDFLASMGADCNLSVMPLSDGFITLPDGTKKLVYSSVTGINAEAAIKKAHEYNNVQLILVGISDEHIRLALEGMDVTFVIPFHGSGNSVHQIQALMNLLGENLDVTTAQDYTLVQSDHVSPNQTEEQKAMWNLRVKIVQGNASTITAAEQALLDKNSFLKDLYRRFYIDKNADEYGVGLTSGQSEQIFPYEYWDKSLTYAEADKNGDRFKEYCASMGIIPRFSGLNSKGERVTYENKAKEKIPYGDFTNNKGYWKLLIDRPMYDNTYDADGNWTGYGKYHEQARINCSNFNVKHLDPEYGSATYGEVMSKANDPKKTNKIVDAALKQFEDAKFSDRGSWDSIESIQGLDGYSVDEVINITTNHINNILEEYGEYAEIIAVRPYGSRAKGTAKTDSDLDIVVQYEGDIREDDMFNMLNDDDGKLYIDGIEVDINPIRVEESGDIEDYLGRVYSFDKYQDAKFSDRDSLGNKLSAEQQEYFKDSKARDKKGNLMVLYHGTTANFNTFKKGDVGFHFGTKGAARGRVGFGKNATLKEVYLNITNPIVFDEDLGSWDADFRLTRELYDMGILTQAEAESVLFTDNRQYKRTTEAANKKLAEVLLSKGYDGIAYQNTFETKKASTSYIVFNSNQAKEITNKTPTSDPDIRYSFRGTNKDGMEVYETSEEIKKLPIKERQKVFLDIMQNQYRGRTAKFVRNGHAYYATFEEDDVRKSIYGDKRSDSKGQKAKINVGAEGTIFELVENSKYTGSKPEQGKSTKSHKGVSYWDYFLKTVQIDNRVYDLVANVRKKVEGSFVYSIQLNENKKIKASPSLNPNKGTLNRMLNAFDNSISQDSDSVNREFSDTDEMHSDRGTNTISNRSLLANALEGVAQNDIEQAKLAQYKAKIALIESEHKKLNELKTEANKLRFTKGRTAEETKRMKALDFEANQVANRINTYDKQLLNLESTKALKSVLEREKANLRKRLEQKGKESLKKQKEKDAATVRELMNRYQESRTKAVEGRHKTELRHKIKNVVSDLNKLLLNPTKDQHVPIGLQLVVAEALDAINMDTMNAEERVAYYNDLIAKSTDPDEIAMLTKKRDFFEYRDANFKERITALKNAYAEFKKSDDPLIKNAHNEAIEDLIEDTADEVGNKSLKDMSYEQLEKVHNMYTAILATVRNFNEMFKLGRQATVTENSEAVKTEVKEVGGHKDRVLKLTKPLKRFGWAMLKPITAMKVIGSKTFEELFRNVRAAEDTWAVDVSEAKKFYDDVSAKYGYKKWDFKKRYSFKDSTGTDFSISLEQMMSLYAYSKREQADQHLEFGGFIFDDAIEVTEKKLGVPLKYEVNDANPYRLGQMQIMEIIGNLSQDQKAFVDEMQTYLSEVMGEKGNEVSLAMYDIKLYNEKSYFPLKTARYFREFDPEKNATPKIKNSGFSKQTVPRAGNPIVLSNFMDVWAAHVNDMSMYHAFVLPLEDFMRVYNYSSTAGGYDSVQQYIKNAYGSQANQYIERLMEDLNGGARVDSSAGFINKGLSLFKKASTFASASVVIQQPSAIARALAYINPKYFVTSAPSAINLIKHKALWAEVKKYAPVAIIKEMGYFDTGVGRSTVEWLKGNQTIKDKVDDILSKAPAIADELGWVYIWEAVKRETQATTNLKVGSEEFLKKSGERFTEVITNTQVYDSTLSRSAMMRSKDTGMKMATAFMAEPTTTVNMLIDGILQGKRGNKKFAAATVGAISASVILNSILVSLVYAARDDDDDETYAEKYIGSLTTELLDGFNPLTYIPFIKDIWSIAQGYDVERSDMSVVSNLWETIEGLFKEDKSGWEKVLDTTGAVSSLFGIPLKNIIRDGKGMYNLTKTLISGTPTTGAGITGAIEDSFKSSIPLWDRLHESDPKSDNLYDAIISGDQNQIDRIKGQYKDEKAIESAMRQALRENDSRIHEAAQARYEGDIAEYTRIAREIIAEGNFSQDTVVSAINAEISAIKRGETTEEEPAEDESKNEATSIYKASDISSALDSGDTAMARQIIDDLIQTKVLNGKTEKEARSSLRSSLTSYWKPLYLQAYRSGNTYEMYRIRQILYSSGLYGSANEVVKTTQNWLKG